MSHVEIPPRRPFYAASWIEDGPIARQLTTVCREQALDAGGFSG